MGALAGPASIQLGAIAQLVERVLCKHEVVGSIPSGSTTLPEAGIPRDRGKQRSFRPSPRVLPWLVAASDIVN